MEQGEASDGPSESEEDTSPDGCIERTPRGCCIRLDSSFNFTASDGNNTIIDMQQHDCSSAPSFCPIESGQPSTSSTPGVKREL